MASSPRKGQDFKESAPLAEVGFPGLRSSAGVMREEILTALSWPKQNSVYKEMSLNDPIVGGILFAIEMIIRKVEWKVKDNGDSKKAEFLETVLHDMDKSWAEVINDILTFLSYGYSVQEIVYKKRMGPTASPKLKSKFSDGLWGWRRLPARSQDTIRKWLFLGDTPGSVGGSINFSDLIGLEQAPFNHNSTQIFIPKERFLLFRNNTKKDNPESTSLLRSAYRPWFFKKRIEEIEAIGIERNLNGIPVAKIPLNYLEPGASADEKAVFNSMMSVVTDLKANQQSGVVWPLSYDEQGNELFKLELLTSGAGSKVMDTTEVIQRYNSNIAQSVLADFILLGQKSVGSFALSSNKTKLFHAAISAWLDSIVSVFNKDAIPPLWELNGWAADDKTPELTYGSIDNHSLEELGEFFGKLVDNGAIQPDSKLESFLRDKADAPEFTGEPTQRVEERISTARDEASLKIAEIQNKNKPDTNFDPGNSDG